VERQAPAWQDGAIKPDNKLGKLRFEPEEAFQKLRELGRQVLSISKKSANAQKDSDDRDRETTPR
jgi:hypothetical protein